MALILTKAGLAALVEAEESGTKLQATHMALGDGNGSIPEHTTSSPSLVNEVWRGALQSITINEQGETDAGKQVVFEAHVPMSAGGWYIREAALYAGDVLLAIGTHPVMWKPAPEEPTKMEHVIKAPVTFGNAGVVSLVVDPTVVLASQEFVNEQIATHNGSQDAHPQLREALDKHSHGWNEIQDKPSAFPPKSHGHGWDEISERPAAFPPSGHNHAWSVITSKPSTFPPSEHSHAWAAITGKPTTFPPASHNHAWTEITNKPAAFPPASHTHEDLHGGCIWFDGAVNSDGRPLDAKTGKPDLRYGVCDGRTYTAPDGRSVQTINARDRFIVSAGGKYSVGSKGGAERVTTSISQEAAHYHRLPIYDPDGARCVYGQDNEGNNATVVNISYVCTNSNRERSQTKCGSQSHENRPPYIGLFLIKYL